MSEDLPPDLDDFTDVIDQIKPKEDQNQQFSGDYTQTREEIEKQFQQNVQQQLQQKLAQQQLERIKLEEEQEKKKQEELKNPPKKKKQSGGGGLFGGMKTGFLGGGGGGNKKKVQQTQQPKQQQTVQQQKKVQEIKYNQKEAEKDKLQFEEVQQAMKMNDFMTQNKEQWMTPDLLSKIATNPNLTKLFTNPEYMNAITMMQKEPKKAMEMYGKNPEFMMLFQEFCKIMGTHFEGMSTQEKEEEKKKQESKPQQQQQQQPMVQEVKKMTPEDLYQQEFEKKLQDPEVQSIIRDPKVQQFMAYVQKTGNVDFRMLAQQDPALAKKIQVLINKGVMNMRPG